MANESKFLTGLDLAGTQIINVADPTADQHAATRAYVLAQIAGAGGYTDEAARDALAAALVAGNNIDITVNDAGDTITIDVEALTSADLSDFATAADARVNALVTGAFVSGLSGVDADTLGGDSKATILAAAATAALDTEEVQDIIGAAITAGNNIDVTYDDGAGTVTIAVEALTSADISDFATAAVAAANAGTIDADTLATYTPANLRDRSTHTGTQAPSTVQVSATSRILGRTTAGAGGAEELTAAQTKTLLAIAPSDISGFDAAAVAAANAGTIDADTLGGSTKAQVIADAISGVVDSAPATLDTLNELAAALGDDAAFSTTVTTALAARAQRYATTLSTSATSYTVTHNLGSKDVIVQVYEVGDDFEQVWCTVKRDTTNTVTLHFAVAPTASQYRCVVLGMA